MDTDHDTRSPLRSILLLLFLGACQGPAPSGDAVEPAVARPRIAFEPRTYLCLRASAPIAVDGKLDEAAWDEASWTEDFVDIQGSLRPLPRFRTRAKMLWNEEFFYVAAMLEEPHVWATYTQRDSVIYREHDIELFLDPDADTHDYYELEINALGTEWDLFLGKPYRDGGPAIHAWDIPGLRSAVHVQGTLNDPSDRDTGWSVEIALPWECLREAAGTESPPRPGERWRVNFSRVEWRTRVEQGAYAKELDPQTGEPFAEDNWVWSPQGLINLHCPEMWGIVEFAPPGAVAYEVEIRAEDRARWALRQVYYAQRERREAGLGYGVELEGLGAPALPSGWSWPPRIATTAHGFDAWLRAPDGRELLIREDGWVGWAGE